MSDDKILGMDGKPVEPLAEHDFSAGVVSLLETILEMARAGKIDGVLLCYTTPEADGGSLYQTSWAGPQITLLGAVNRASYAINRDLDQQDKGYTGDAGR